MTWLILICFFAVTTVIYLLIEKGLDKGGKKVTQMKLKKDLVSEDILTNNIWQFQTTASISDIWQQLQQYVITGEADKGNLYVVSAHENKIIWALQLKGTTIGFTAQLDIEKNNQILTAIFSFTKWSFSSGELPFLREMRMLLQAINSAFQSADNNFKVVQVLKGK